VTGRSGEENRDRTAGTRQPGQTVTVGTGQQGQDSCDRTAVIRPPSTALVETVFELKLVKVLAKVYGSASKSWWIIL
jgi:hypothetical protein